MAKLHGEGEGDWRSFRAKSDEADVVQLEMAMAVLGPLRMLWPPREPDPLKGLPWRELPRT